MGITARMTSSKKTSAEQMSSWKWLLFFLYDPGFSNSVTRSKPADYIVFIEFPNPDFSMFSSRIDTTAWKEEFSLVYEDSQGKVYKRR